MIKPKPANIGKPRRSFLRRHTMFVFPTHGGAFPFHYGSRAQLDVTVRGWYLRAPCEVRGTLYVVLVFPGAARLLVPLLRTLRQKAAAGSRPILGG